jgi:hypothetical protein
MQNELDTYLAVALKKLEKACAEVMKTKGYSKETEKMKMLQELVKEQVKNENSGSATR